MKRKLTDLGVTRIRKPKSGRLELWDTVLPAFGLRITATGARTWIVATRRPGNKHPVRLKVGTPDEPDRMPLADARVKARQLMEGGAPTLPVTFKELAGQFLDHGRTKRGRSLRPASIKEYRRALLTYAAPLHAKPVRDVRRGEIAGLIRDVAGARGSTSAMRTRAALSRFWGWMLANDMVEVNVVAGTEGYSTPKRSRVLSDGELRALWEATAEPSDFKVILRLMLWTGCRRGEAGGMAWTELVERIWTVSGARTKNHRPLVLPLPRQAVATLEKWPRLLGKETLWGRADQGFSGWSAAKRRLDIRLGYLTAEGKPAKGFKSWHLHDLRRTVETRMAGLGIPKEHVNRLLNHAAGPITEAYDHWDYLPQKSAALQRWADELERVTSAQSGSALGIYGGGVPVQ